MFNATFNNISVISWRSALLAEETGVQWRKPPICRKSLTKLYRVQSPWAGFELTTLITILVVNVYHAIMTTTATDNNVCILFIYVAIIQTPFIYFIINLQYHSSKNFICTTFYIYIFNNITSSTISNYVSRFLAIPFRPLVFIAANDLKLSGFLSFWPWEYLMNVISETRRAH